MNRVSGSPEWKTFEHQFNAVGLSVLPGFARLKPFPQGLLSLARPTARQEAVCADILIQIRPVDSRVSAYAAPVGPLRRRPVQRGGNQPDACFVVFDFVRNADDHDLMAPFADRRAHNVRP